MKKIINLGKTLSRIEKQQINGGGCGPTCKSDLHCACIPFSNCLQGFVPKARMPLQEYYSCNGYLIY